MIDAAIQPIWITSRAAGITALVLASLSVAVGLTIGAKSKRGPGLRTAHEALALATLVAVGVHGIAILADPWLQPGLLGTLVPFATSYRPAAVAAGIVAGYGLAVLGLSYYARARFGVARWRKLHRFTALFWVLAVIHGFAAGSDATQPWFILSVGLVVVPAVGLLVARLAGGRSAAPAPAPRAPASRTRSLPAGASARA